MKTYSATPSDIEHRWYVVDADGMLLGRFASEVAKIIRGNHKPMYTPHMDTGDNVIVSADSGQNLILKSSGVGSLQLFSSGSGNIQLEGPTQITGGDAFTTSNGTPVIFTNGTEPGNLKLTSNDIQATNTNGGISLSPNGNGGTYITNGNVDLVSSKLPALQAYQLSLSAPPAPAGSFDAAAALRGKLVFDGAGQCVTCHSGATYTDANSLLHPPSDSMAEPETPSYASRSATKLYRTSPLKGVWQHAPYFHDGSAATLADAVQTYNTKKSLGLSAQEVADVAEYLKSL